MTSVTVILCLKIFKVLFVLPPLEGKIVLNNRKLPFVIDHSKNNNICYALADRIVSVRPRQRGIISLLYSWILHPYYQSSSGQAAGLTSLSVWLRTRRDHQEYLHTLLDSQNMLSIYIYTSTLEVSVVSTPPCGGKRCLKSSEIVTISCNVQTVLIQMVGKTIPYSKVGLV